MKKILNNLKANKIVRYIRYHSFIYSLIIKYENWRVGEPVIEREDERPILPSHED